MNNRERGWPEDCKQCDLYDQKKQDCGMRSVGLTLNGWYCALSKVRSGRSDKWVIMVDDGRDDRMEE